ncbi:MAG: hypothetical protein ABIM21_08245, partial [candidate division WOR-3 bacterium]
KAEEYWAARKERGSGVKPEEMIDLSRLTENFDRGLHEFYTNQEAPFSWFRRGPCIHFHRRTINKLRDVLKSGSYAQVLNDSEYIELLYATLTAWGMNRLGKKGPKLRNFEEFEKIIKSLKVETAERLGKYTLSKLGDVSEIEDPLKEIYESLGDIMETRCTIVGISKTLHHIFPDLLMPVDGSHVLRLLANLKEEEYRTSDDNTFENYWKCIKVSWGIAKALREKRGILTPSDWKPENPDFRIAERSMDTSIPKMIDNALIGMSSLLPKERKGENSETVNT